MSTSDFHSRPGQRMPSLDALQVFAVAARRLSFTAAAAELHRTQGAVSHRIKSLEGELGVTLFERGARGLRLTAAGTAIAQQVERSMLDIAHAIAIAGHARGGDVLKVTMLPSLASHWLMPRLADFQRLRPGLQVQVIADARLLDLAADDIDLAVRFGHGRWRGLESTPLMRDHALPVCSPALLHGRGTVDTVAALLALPRLHDAECEGDGSLSDWRAWLDAIGGHDIACSEGQRFSQAGLAIEAAVHGLGVALARVTLVADHLSSGALVVPYPAATPTAYGYHLVMRPARDASAARTAFVQWLHEQARQTEALVARWCTVLPEQQPGRAQPAAG